MKLLKFHVCIMKLKIHERIIANFITNGVTDSNWQTFLDTAKSVGVDRYIELYQKAYDNYLANQ